MKKFEISACFLGMLFAEIEADSAKEAKEKFLTSLGTTLNGFGDPSVTIENISVTETLVLKELNMAFPNTLTEEDKKHWEGIEAEESEE